MVYRASRFWGGWKSLTKFIIPDRIEIFDDRVVARKRGWFGLTGTDEEISLSKIASVRMERGFFTGAVLIETAGGAIEDIEVRAFNKRTAFQLVKSINEKIKNEDVLENREDNLSSKQ